MRWLARTALLAGLGAVIMVALGQVYALTQATCSTICNPRVAGPLKGRAPGTLYAKTGRRICCWRSTSSIPSIACPKFVERAV